MSRATNISKKKQIRTSSKKIAAALNKARAEMADKKALDGQSGETHIKLKVALHVIAELRRLVVGLPNHQDQVYVTVVADNGTVHQCPFFSTKNGKALRDAEGCRFTATGFARVFGIQSGTHHAFNQVSEAKDLYAFFIKQIVGIALLLANVSDKTELELLVLADMIDQGVEISPDIMTSMTDKEL